MEALVCPNCGGKVTVTEESAKMLPGKVFVIKSGVTAKCDYCKTEFRGGDGQQFRGGTVVVQGNGNTVVGGGGSAVVQGNGNTVVGGGAFVRGNVNTDGGDFIGGSKVVIGNISNIDGGSVFISGGDIRWGK